MTDIKFWARVALMAAVIAVLAQVAIPLPWGVPITGQLVGVFLAGAILGSRGGTWALVIYILLGVIGLPVFAQGKAGVGVLVGPTGGYIIGFVLGVYFLGKIVEAAKSPTFRTNALGMAVCMLTSYALGTVQFAWVTGRSLGEALLLAVVPYVALDLVKLVIAASLALAVRQALIQAGLVKP